MGPGAPQMAQEVVRATAGLFERIGQDGKVSRAEGAGRQVARLVKGARQLEDDPSIPLPPGRLNDRLRAEGAAKQVAQEMGLAGALDLAGSDPGGGGNKGGV